MDHQTIRRIALAIADEANQEGIRYNGQVRDALARKTPLEAIEAERLLARLCYSISCMATAVFQEFSK